MDLVKSAVELLGGTVGNEVCFTATVGKEVCDATSTSSGVSLMISSSRAVIFGFLIGPVSLTGRVLGRVKALQGCFRGYYFRCNISGYSGFCITQRYIFGLE